jgi:hypothetical protein
MTLVSFQPHPRRARQMGALALVCQQEYDPVVSLSLIYGRKEKNYG